MNSSFEIAKNGLCGITVTGTEGNSYLTGDNTVSVRNYTFAESITLDAITGISSEETETYETSEVVPHTDVDSTVFELKHDGLYKITHIIIPTVSWLTKAKSLDPDSLKLYTSIYYFDSTTEKWYQYNVDTQTSQEVTVSQILEVNDTGSTLIRSDSYTFNLCYLTKCNADLSIKILTDSTLCYDNGYQYNRFLRDMIWMGMNVIKYYLESNLYIQAQAVLEKMTGCGTICGDITGTAIEGGIDCGCTK